MPLVPPAGPFPGPLDRVFVTSVRATTEALFPPDPGGAPDAEATDLAPRVEAYVRGLPPSQRGLVMLLFVAVDLLALLTSPLGGRLSRRPPERRLAVVEGWRHSRIYPLRLVGDALRATLMMVYLSHPAVLRHIGEYKPRENPGDPLAFDVRPLPLAEEA